MQLGNKSQSISDNEYEQKWQGSSGVTRGFPLSFSSSRTAFFSVLLVHFCVSFLNPFAAMMSLDSKQPQKARKLKSLGFVCLFRSSIALACTRIFIKTHSIEGRFAIGPGNLLFTGVCMHSSARKFDRLHGSMEGLMSMGQ